jgi:RNA polymerase sigma-70 factor (ECF subfamily)
MDSVSDLELVRLCQAGDITAFDVLVRRHQERVYRLVYRMLGGSHEAEDIAQEIFIKAYKAIKKFRCDSSFSTWLTQIAVNQCINHCKKRNKIKLLSLGLATKKRSSEPHAIAEHNEKREIVTKEVNALSIKHKTVIILHYFESYSYEEIADILKCSSGTVKSRLFHARMELKNKLKPILEGDEWIEHGSDASA